VRETDVGVWTLALTDDELVDAKLLHGVDGGGRLGLRVRHVQMVG
jgi:hypothetical protein